MTANREVWIYEEGDVLKVFDSAEDALAWFAENAPEGVALRCEPGPLRPAGSAEQYSVPRAEE